MNRLTLFVLFVIVSAITEASAQRNRYNQERKTQKVAILEPTAVDGNVTSMQKEIIRGAMEETITSISGYQAFTRTDVDQIMRELRFQQSGMVDDADRKRLGAMSGADLLCLIAITVEEADFFVKCSLVDVQTGEIIRTATQLMPTTPRNKLYYGCVNLASYLITGEKKASAMTSTQTGIVSGTVATSQISDADMMTAKTLTKEGLKAYSKFDYVQAFELFRKAADLGSLESLYRLSCMWSEGQGTKRDIEVAFALMLKSATGGYTPAFLPLGQMYEQGRGTSKNKSRARSWYLKASNSGDESANYKLNDL